MSTSYDSNIAREPSQGGSSGATDPIDIGDGLISSTEFNYLDNATSNLQTQINAVAAAAAFTGVSVGVATTQNITTQTPADVLWTDIVAPTAHVTHSAASASITIVTAGIYSISGVLNLFLTSNTTGWGLYTISIYSDSTEIFRSQGVGYRDNTAEVISPIAFNWVGALTANKVIKITVLGGNGTGTFDVLGTVSGAKQSTMYIKYEGP